MEEETKDPLAAATNPVAPEALPDSAPTAPDPAALRSAREAGILEKAKVADETKPAVVTSQPLPELAPAPTAPPREEPKLPADVIPTVIGAPKQETTPVPIAAGGVTLQSIKLPETPQKAELPSAGERASAGLASPETPVVKLEIPTPPPRKEGLPRIRTYAGDMSTEIQKRGATLSTIVNEERTKLAATAPQVPQPQSVWKRLLITLGVVLFLALGAGAIIFAVFSSSEEPILAPASSMIFVNEHSEVSFSQEKTLVQTLAQARTNSTVSLGEIEEVTVTKDGVALTAQEILSLLSAPNALSRNAEMIMVGIHALNGNQPFLLITVSPYDVAFKALLLWEKTMGAQLGALFAPKGKTGAAPALTFSDRIFQNIDIRESGKEWPIVYAFIDQKTLLITTNDSTIKEVLTRFSTRK